MIEPQPPARKRILIIDDDQDIRETLGDLLETEGYGVLFARDGAEALGLLQQGSPPSMILLDLMMPTMSGWQFAPALQQDPSLRGVPVAVITAHDRGRTPPPEGVCAVFTKPLDVDRLLQCIEDNAVETAH